MTDKDQPKRFYRLNHIAPAEVEENGKVSVCVRCMDAEGKPRAWVFYFSDLYRAMVFREAIIFQDGLER